MRALITGGAGFVGVNLARLLTAHGHAVVCFDDFSTGRRLDAEGAGYETVIEGTILDPSRLTAAALYEAGRVVNAA